MVGQSAAVDFFARQDRARCTSVKLVALFVLAVVAIVAVIDVVVVILLRAQTAGVIVTYVVIASALTLLDAPVRAVAMETDGTAWAPSDVISPSPSSAWLLQP